MGELMGQHAFAGVVLRGVLTGLKDHVATDGVCVRLDGARRLARLGIGVDPHIAEVGAHA